LRHLAPLLPRRGGGARRGHDAEGHLPRSVREGRRPVLGREADALPLGLPHAAGIGYAVKYRKEDAVVACWFGEGATSEGDWHEGLNFAGIHRLPVVF